jgi:Protein of unknown function (DUF1236)
MFEDALSWRQALYSLLSQEQLGSFLMRKQLLAGVAVAATLLSVPAMAQTTVIERERPPTVGGAVGGAVDAALSIPGAVIDFVIGAPGPSVRVEERVVVGEPLPRVVEVRRIPDSEYSYAIVNERRVIVEPRSRRVVRIIER